MAAPSQFRAPRWLALAAWLFARLAAAQPNPAGLRLLVNAERAGQGAAPLAERAALDAVAAARAQEIARTPDGMGEQAGQTPLRELIERHGAGLVLEGQEYQILRSAPATAADILGLWHDSGRAWLLALDPRFDAMGVGTAATAEGFVVVAIVLVRDARIPDDLGPTERAVVEAVNKIRAARGLAPLGLRADLSEVARAHSRDMAARRYFAHRSPEGELVGGRLRAAGLVWRVAAENIARTTGYEDPVGIAVSGWLESPGHLANIVFPEFSETGVGIVVDASGTYFFTQVFRSP